MIDKIKGLGSSYEPKKTTPSRKTEVSGLSGDNIEISETAKLRANELKMQSDVKSITQSTLSQTEDVERLDKIREIKSKIKNGTFDDYSSEVINKTADNLLKAFFG